jgi:phosphoglycerol transferase MdoB-like AlkP superfamily enzyme
MNEAVPKRPYRALPEKLKNCTILFGGYSLALLIAFLALRIMEFVCILLANATPPDIRYVVAHAFLNDFISFPVILFVLFIPFAIVYLSTGANKTRYWLWIIGGLTIILVYATLIKYFTNELVPLGADLYGYSFDEIHETIRNGVTFNTATIVLLTLPAIVFWVIFSLLHSRKLIKPGYTFILFGTIILLACTAFVLPARASYKTELSQNLALNKAVYFVEESCSYLTRSLLEGNIDHDLLKDGVQTFKNLNPDYPFLRVDKTPDVLGELFNIAPNGRPNIVFILVEGLGRSFSGPNARLGSFTPFLDELSAKSLYWENFLATQGRTFGALPSILASLPYGEKGFLNLGERMPNYLSLLHIMKHDGYRIKYYMSSDPDFDNEGLFLQRQGVDVMVSLNDFGSEYQKSPGIDWNFPDRDLVQKTLKMERTDQKEPYVTIIQTISMHTIYTVPDQEKYLNRFEEQMTWLGLNETQKKEYRLYKGIYSTIMYTDDALNLFFREYEKLPAYQNTIFIVTGDHRLPEIPMGTKIERYHVPLIIFSPLLKHPASIRSISSHLDIAPSLLAYLHHNYDLEIPSLETWVGTGLDTEQSFRNIHKYPLKQTKGLLVDYLSGIYFINHENLFQVMKNMGLKPIQDEVKRKQLISEFEQYKMLNNQFIRELKLIPDNMYKQFAKTVKPESGTIQK